MSCMKIKTCILYLKDKRVTPYQIREQKNSKDSMNQDESFKKNILIPFFFASEANISPWILLIWNFIQGLDQAVESRDTLPDFLFSRFTSGRNKDTKIYYYAKKNRWISPGLIIFTFWVLDLKKLLSRFSGLFHVVLNALSL